MFMELKIIHKDVAVTKNNKVLVFTRENDQRDTQALTSMVKYLKPRNRYLLADTVKVNANTRAAINTQQNTKYLPW